MGLRAALLGGVLLAVQGTAVQIPAPPRGFGTSAAEVVVDDAHVLSPESVDLINRIAFDVHAKSGGEMAVVTVPDIGQRDVSAVALQILRGWKIGAAGKPGDPARNRGVVVLIVPKETSSDGRGHVRIETGLGSEGFITDAQAGDIIREATPQFQARDYGGATSLIALRVAERFATEFNFALDTALAAAPQLTGPATYTGPIGGGGGGFNPMVLFIAFVVLMVVLNMLGGGRRRGRGGCGGGGCLPLFIPMGGGGFGGGGFGGRGGGWGGGGFGGGGGGFGGFGGGGGGGGGGASGSW
ncbi:MAG TPA: TPM domain-containing protein [Gemmatimonadaceae bacterium]|nr:TPM domain-containing protein [Gemmatimonadaceae bacterium]